MFIPMFSDTVFLKNTDKNYIKIFLKNYLFYLVAFIFVSGNSCDSVLVSQRGLSLVSRDVKRQIHSLTNTLEPTHPPVIKSNFPTNLFFC